MSKRTVAILSAALVVLLALVIFGQRSSAPVSSGAALVPDLQAALGDISRVTVVKANGETVATLEKGADNWVVSDKHGYVANAAKLRQALTALAEAHILEEKTANPELYARHVGIAIDEVAGRLACAPHVAKLRSFGVAEDDRRQLVPCRRQRDADAGGVRGRDVLDAEPRVELRIRSLLLENMRFR